jgi:hypothetical protein
VSELMRELEEMRAMECKISKLEERNAALLEALQECLTDNPGAACYNTGKKTRRLEAINEIARSAIAKANRS